MKKVFFITLLIFLLFLETAYAEDTTYLNKGYGFSIAYPSNYRVLKNLRGAPLIIFFPPYPSIRYATGISLKNKEKSKTLTKTYYTRRG